MTDIEKIALYSSKKKEWADCVASWSAEPILLGAVTGGDKYQYTYPEITLYRFVPDPYVASSDVFYTDTGLTEVYAIRGTIKG